MATYIIGDVHGCYDELQQLLDKIEFSLSSDRLVFVGDLINRGKDSLKVVRYIRSLGSAATVVLGNHDVSLIAYSEGLALKGNGFAEIMSASDADDIISWLCQMPLFYQLPLSNHYVVHAGLSPDWSILEAMQWASWAEGILKGDRRKEYLINAYQQGPDRWDLCQSDFERFRYILNTLTRIRYIYSDHTLDFLEKGVYGKQKNNLFAWFDCYPKLISEQIIFGHWAALGYTENPPFYCIDNGLVWGGSLVAISMEKEKIKKYQIKAK